jgi:excisionase family DNA binding protein
MDQEITLEKSKEQCPSLEPIAYTAEEAAAVARVCRDTIYRAIARGKLRASKYLRHKRIHRSELNRWLLGEPIAAPGRTSLTKGLTSRSEK